jgi:hypothetical protein
MKKDEVLARRNWNDQKFISIKNTNNILSKNRVFVSNLPKAIDTARLKELINRIIAKSEK